MRACGVMTIFGKISAHLYKSNDYYLHEEDFKCIEQPCSTECN